MSTSSTEKKPLEQVKQEALVKANALRGHQALKDAKDDFRGQIRNVLEVAKEENLPSVLHAFIEYQAARNRGPWLQHDFAKKLIGDLQELQKRFASNADLAMASQRYLLGFLARGFYADKALEKGGKS